MTSVGSQRHSKKTISWSSIWAPAVALQMSILYSDTRKHLWPDSFHTYADSVLKVLHISSLVRRAQCSCCTRSRIFFYILLLKCRSSSWLSVTNIACFSLGDRTYDWCYSHAVVSFYSFLNLSWTFNNDFVSGNHRTHRAFPLSIYIIKRAQRNQRQSKRHWDVLTLSEHEVRTRGMWKKLEWRNPVMPLLLFYTARILYYWRSKSYNS